MMNRLHRHWVTAYNSPNRANVHMMRDSSLPEKSGCRIAAVPDALWDTPAMPNPAESSIESAADIYPTIVPMCPGANLRALISFAGPSFNYMAEGSVYRHARIGAISVRNHRAHWIWILSAAVHSSDLSVTSAPYEIPKDILALSLSLSLCAFVRLPI